MLNPTTLDDWLSHCERQHPLDIDLTLERTRQVKENLGLNFAVPVITVAGTNGKGSTCAMLESIALHAGYRVGLYIKPHFVHFEERCRVNGAMVSAGELVPHFAAVERARQGLTLTYFEFTTLAIMRLLSQAPLDMVILEVGLGGRLDAVNVIDTDCAIITSIDLDHMDYLGPDRESIGREKAGIMRSAKPVVVSDPVPPQSLIDHAKELGADLRLIGRDFNYSGDQQQWRWAGRQKRFDGLAYPALRGVNQLLNASGALAAFEAMREHWPVSAQDVRNGLANVELTGRFQIVPGQPTLVLDVAHNPHAVATLVRNLDQMGYFRRTHVVFGAMRDKDIEAILTLMAPVVDGWYFCDLGIERAAKAVELKEVYQNLVLSGPAAVTLQCFAGSAQALQAALEGADPADRIVVFGSFFTVGGILKNGLPRLVAKHIG